MSLPTHLLFPFFFFFFVLLFYPTLVPGLPDKDPAAIQPFHPASAPPITIPAFPEQSNVVGCPLDLPDELFRSVKTACGGSSGFGQLRRSRCCPVLAAWLYSAYSATALGSAGRVGPTATTYDMPLLPDDSETCVDTLDKGLKQKKVVLVRPNETCDLVYCYCGIRLHPLSCPEAFSVNQKGKLVGDRKVRRLERDCLSSSTDVNGFPGLDGCSKCLTSLHKLNINNGSSNNNNNNNNKTLHASKSEDRTTKMHNKDCQLMGLTWLLAKNRTAYIHTVSSVLRATMMSTDGSDPQSCTINSDGMPLAVDSSEISNNSLSVTHQARIFVTIGLVCLLLMLLVPSTQF